MIYRLSTHLLALISVAASFALIEGAELVPADTLSDVCRPEVALPANLTGPALPPSAATSAATGSLTPDEIRRIGRDAYVWGWPLVYVQKCRAGLEKLPMSGRRGGAPVAPPNELCMLTDYISPTQTVVPCPNQDVVYGYGILDLAIEPVVIQVPDFGDRFWLYQLGDHRTDGFADIGKMYGTKPGHYLVVGPDWKGTAPQGIVAVLRCPTRTGYCLPRVFLDDTATDRLAIQPVINQIMAYPLSQYTGAVKTRDWSKARWLPNVGPGARKGSKVVAPETFFDDLAEVLADVPPLPGEEAMYADYRRLLEAADRDPNAKTLLTATAVAADAEVLAPMFEFRNLGVRLPHNWTTVNNGAAFGTDYLTRAAVARSNVYVNRSQETKYFYQDLDAEGRRLNGSRSYRVTFAAGKLPPTKGFWSLTLYNEQHGFHPNSLNRFSLGTKNKTLRYNADGSLTFVIQAQAPTADEQANWLPAPEGNFSLYLRAYWPEAAITDGAWTPPAVATVDVQLAAK